MTQTAATDYAATSPTNIEAVRSGDWLAEQEAALADLMARHGAAVANDWPGEERLWREVLALSHRIESERRRSAST